MKQAPSGSADTHLGGERHMRVRLLTVVCLALAVRLSAQQQNAAEVMLGAGLHLEEIEGNCREAIKVYERVTRLSGVPRATAARAQLHIGTCREQLGMREARDAYELVLKRYSDQPQVAAAARERIGSLSARSRAALPTTAIASRRVWTRDPVMSLVTMSKDGRYVAYRNFLTLRSVYVRDLVRSEERQLTADSSDSVVTGVVFSPDGGRVLYATFNRSDNRHQLRLVDLQAPATASGVASSTAVATQLPSAHWIYLLDWSPDGKTIALWVQESRQIALVDVSSGALRAVNVVPSYSHARFSPDGKYLAS